MSGKTGHLAREISLLGLIATAFAAMVGVGINILPFVVQRSQPGVGAMVPAAFVIAAVPAALAALCYAILSSAMPRAGGSYVNATRALSPFGGFLASFAQWFGLSIGMGVVSYLLVSVVRDLVASLGGGSIASAFDSGIVRVPVALLTLWFAWAVNVVGVKTYERTIVLLAIATIIGPVIMTITGLMNTPADFQQALEAKSIVPPPAAPIPIFSWRAFLGTCVALFASFIGFDAVSQAGGEARNASDLPKSILIAIAFVATYYIIFTWSVYHAVPWQHIYRESLVHDISAPGLLTPLLPSWLGVVILAAVVIAIVKVNPAVMLANSRTLYAFSTDRIFPAVLSRVHPRYQTPHHAITATALCASASVIGCHFAGDFFLGIDILVVSMLVNFFLMAVAVLTFPHVNRRLYERIGFMRSRPAQVMIASLAVVLLGALLLIQIVADFRASTPWYLRSVTNWLIVMAGASLVYASYRRRLRQQGVDARTEIFDELPPE